MGLLPLSPGSAAQLIQDEQEGWVNRYELTLPENRHGTDATLPRQVLGCPLFLALSTGSNCSSSNAQAPVVAVLGSGGGLRAHIACLGVLSEMKELGLLDAITYLAGVSGSTW